MARILVAERNGLVANTIETMLRSGGHEVVLAGRADEAIRAFTAQPFELVLCDLQMRGTDGLDLAQEFRGLSPDVVLILMTGGPPGSNGTARLDPQLLQSWQIAGTAKLIAKPIRTDEILALVRGHLAAKAPAERDAPGRDSDA